MKPRAIAVPALRWSRMKPEFAVIFTSQRSPGDDGAYLQAAQRMMDLAQLQPGFIKADSVRDDGGLGITVSYWSSLKAIDGWKNQVEHLAVQKQGKHKWYQSFTIKVCRIERGSDFARGD